MIHQKVVNSDNYIGGWLWLDQDIIILLLLINERKQNWLWANVYEFTKGVWCTSRKESERFDKDTNKIENSECTSSMS